ncbi:uncharacterized protein (DUF2236 family) [Haloferula luteola]|uniref:Uncharacterized protein (DUF2236 family) n=1 Tax=Haloferula luteola TaxID=595692 RepID=A0A840VE21_9BACT|nr:oxygenase MpaB family protein [Haloferula luteola]MBB5353754.1 uncharacterized protein (DUF2236 family) [Haloferula luteola]
MRSIRGGEMIGVFQKSMGRRFRALLCGDPSGTPPWLGVVAEGEGPGFYEPNEAPWVVHEDLATLVGGVRALLMQALHPGSLAGVRDHSRYEADPLGRLAGTIQWLTITTFASREGVMKEAARVRGMHGRVKGSYEGADGLQKSYRASDPELLKWVHIAFTDSFLRCHQAYSARPIPGGADAYVRLWARSVVPLGLEDAPLSEAGLVSSLEGFEADLVVNESTREVLRWLENPPLPWVAGRVYRLLFHAAYATLPEGLQDRIGLRTWPKAVLQPVTRAFLKALRMAIGPESPIQDVAIERLERSGWRPNGGV